MDMAAKEALQLLQHHVCRDYKKSQRGNGMGGVHHRHNAHRLYLIPKMDEIQHVKKPSDDDRSLKGDKVTIKMISPAQATLERAENQIGHRKKEKKELQPKTKHQKITRKTIKPITLKIKFTGYTLNVFGYSESRKYVCLTRYDIEIHVHNPNNRPGTVLPLSS